MEMTLTETPLRQLRRSLQLKRFIRNASKIKTFPFLLLIIYQISQLLLHHGALEDAAFKIPIPRFPNGKGKAHYRKILPGMFH